ncbi:MAG: hypothetical protein ACI4M6_01355 [Christensenellaceae bacterium]
MRPFFSNEEKKIAKTTPDFVLKNKYEESEKLLKKACKTGKIKNIKRAMKEHHKYEYALLYQTYYKNKITPYSGR